MSSEDEEDTDPFSSSLSLPAKQTTDNNDPITQQSILDFIQRATQAREQRELTIRKTLIDSMKTAIRDWINNPENTSLKTIFKVNPSKCDIPREDRERIINEVKHEIMTDLNVAANGIAVVIVTANMNKYNFNEITFNVQIDTTKKSLDDLEKTDADDQDAWKKCPFLRKMMGSSM